MNFIDKYHCISLSEFNDMLSDILGPTADHNYKSFIKFCKKVDKYSNEAKDLDDFLYNNSYKDDDIKKFLTDYYNSGEYFFDFVEKILDPKDNNFTYETVDNFNPLPKKEVWTDGESLLINVSFIDSITPKEIPSL